MLTLNNLRKTYGNFVAVKGISFQLEPGDIFGFIGSNGAGKTTTIKMLSTLLEPTSGSATLDGYDLEKQPMEVRKRIGYMPDFFGLYDDVKVWEYLDFFATIYGVPSSQRKEVIDNALSLTDLTLKKDSFVQSLSRGMQQRLCLAKCLVHNPSLLLLDEPASGLDPRARSDLKELLLELSRMGKMIIVSSHILPELSDFCNKVGIIEKGELLLFGSVQEIVKGIQSHRQIRAKFIDSADLALSFVAVQPLVAQVKTLNEHELTFDFTGNDEDQAQLLAACVQAGLRPLAFSEESLDLQDVFLSVTTGAVN
ncbi:MAG: ABC transporter ATP-binding protein [Fimbriimonadaceae bacterium]|jgi:ABC-2 type transport system ATP-binding protein|nr:ABC transporter ATP-binding protein [Fimbriimonadaceae bacterium]